MNKEILTELYKTDLDFINKYHILAPNCAEICAERTIEDLKNIDVYLIQEDSKIIGYYGINGLSLTGFFIKKENRNKDTIGKFWNEIESKFESSYYCGIYTKNTRAINFIRKKSIEEYPINDSIFFKMRNNLCQ